MEESSYQEVIKLYYSGASSELDLYSGLAVQAIAVLVGGIILWRASAILHKRKKAQRGRNEFFETPYSKGWKRK
ncbi:hypothetical protein N9089_03680 [Crocinitomicaceae bacterium]|nr:hypothetical protein [Crocinitomicaceae bacterium]